MKRQGLRVASASFPRQERIRISVWWENQIVIVEGNAVRPGRGDFPGIRGQGMEEIGRLPRIEQFPGCADRGMIGRKENDFEDVLSGECLGEFGIRGKRNPAPALHCHHVGLYDFMDTADLFFRSDRRIGQSRERNRAISYHRCRGTCSRRPWGGRNRRGFAGLQQDGGCDQQDQCAKRQPAVPHALKKPRGEELESVS